MSDGSMLNRAASRSTTSSRTSSGRSAGRTFTANVGTFFTSNRPLRSYMKPRGAGIGSFTVRCWFEMAANCVPLVIWR